MEGSRNLSVDFNNIRKRACIAYDRLVRTLNKGITGDEEVFVDACDIEGDLEVLRSMIGAIACVYSEGDDNLRDVFSDVYGEDGGMEVFNP